jgi:rhodanese-related sulfurtransferase
VEIEPEVLNAELQGGRAVILDVRSAAEFSTGHVPGAINLPFWAALFRAGALPARRDDPIVVYCGHGPRAHMAARALRLRGFRNLRFLRGHMAGWLRAGLPIEK